MPAEPASKRTFVFVDGQNLFYAVKLAFGYSFPNYDIPRLARAICTQGGWNLAGVRFYTGIPSAADNPHGRAHPSRNGLGWIAVRPDQEVLNGLNLWVNLCACSG